MCLSIKTDTPLYYVVTYRKCIKMFDIYVMKLCYVMCLPLVDFVKIKDTPSLILLHSLDEVNLAMAILSRGKAQDWDRIGYI